MANTIQLDTGAPTPPPAPVAGDVTETSKGVQFGAPPTPPAPTPKADERPAGLPEKFKNVEELAKSYEELSKKLGAPAPAPTPANTDITVDSLLSSLDADGKLPDKAYADLAAKGISRSVADRYLAGQQAVAAQQSAALAEAVGGQENMKVLMEWAGKNLTKAEIDGYNSQIDAGNIDAAKLMLGAFEQKYVDKNGSEPTLVNASSASSGSGEAGFASQAEMITAMKDKRYTTDPAYRDSVVRRLGKTNAF